MNNTDKVLITGGAGFIGSHLATVLIQQGYTVTVVDDLSTGLYSNVADLEKHPSFSLYVDSVLEEKLMDRLMQENRIVFHLASAVGVKLIMENPVFTINSIFRGTEAILHLARRYRNHVLITSTSEVYGKSTAIPFSEDGDRLQGATTLHRWAYACAKALDEFLALAHWKETQLPVVIARLFNTVGPRQRSQYGMVLPKFVGWALNDEPLQVHGDGTQTRCFCHVNDVVRALIQLMACRSCVGQIFNVGNVEEISISDLALHVKNRLNSSSEIRFRPYHEVYGEGFEDMQRRVPSIEKIREAVGWQPSIDLNQIIDDIAEDMRGRLHPPIGKKHAKVPH